MAREPLSFAVLGPGGVGGLLGALLARAGCSVVVIAGDETARAIAQGGLRVESGKFDDFNVRVRTATRLAESVDACLVTVKATQLGQALQRVPADILGDGLVIPFLNGLDHLDLLRTIYPPACVVAATIRVEESRVRPGLIRHTSPFALIEIAPTAVNRARIEKIADQLRATGLDVRVREDELATLWDKFSMLEPLALLTTPMETPIWVAATMNGSEVDCRTPAMSAFGRPIRRT